MIFLRADSSTTSPSSSRLLYLIDTLGKRFLGCLFITKKFPLGYDHLMNSHTNQIAGASPSRGIIMIVLGVSIAAFTGVTMKILGDQISAAQVAWFRFAGMSIILAPYLIWRYGLKGLKPARPVVQIIRGLTMAAGTSLFVMGSQTVDYADAIAILYAYPFLLVIIAVLFLGERANWTVWVGITSGFFGVLLVIRPEFGKINIGTVYIFFCAIVIGIQLALNRKLGAISPPLITAFFGALCATITLTLLLPGTWQPIPNEAWLYIGLLIFAGTINQVLLVYAFVYADASTLAPFTYFEIVSAVIFGYLFFDTMPSTLSWIGIFLITTGGLYVARALHLNNISRRTPKI